VTGCLKCRFGSGLSAVKIRQRGLQEKYMSAFEQKRKTERVAYRSSLQFTVLPSETSEFERVRTNGEIIDASEAGVCIITEFPLKPGHVLEWDDKHQRGKLHIALVKWSREQGEYYRAGLMFI
jgi:hypothetical protein